MTQDQINGKPAPDSLADAARDWIAIDGLWFQAVERAYGMKVAIDLDRMVWMQFAKIEAERIKKRLKLPESGGLDALDAALRARLVNNVHSFTIERPDQHTLIFTITGCRVQAARMRKQMEPFACKPVGLIEFPVFASTIDYRIRTDCLSCPPETIPGVPFCQWKFTLRDE
jgi:hypothetical protein